MTAPEVEAEELRWLRYAREDLDLAQDLFAQDHPVPRHPCWLSQQAAEKALKAVLVLADGEAPFIHDLEVLLQLLPDGWPDALVTADLGSLTQWTADARYPVARPEPRVEDAALAVAEATTVYDVIAGEFASRGVTDA